MAPRTRVIPETQLTSRHKKEDEFKALLAPVNNEYQYVNQRELRQRVAFANSIMLNIGIPIKIELKGDDPKIIAKNVRFLDAGRGGRGGGGRGQGRGSGRGGRGGGGRGQGRGSGGGGGGGGGTGGSRMALRTRRISPSSGGGNSPGMRLRSRVIVPVIVPTVGVRRRRGHQGRGNSPQIPTVGVRRRRGNQGRVNSPQIGVVPGAGSTSPATSQAVLHHQVVGSSAQSQVPGAPQGRSTSPATSQSAVLPQVGSSTGFVVPGAGSTSPSTSQAVFLGGVVPGAGSTSPATSQSVLYSQVVGSGAQSQGVVIPGVSAPLSQSQSAQVVYSTTCVLVPGLGAHPQVPGTPQGRSTSSATSQSGVHPQVVAVVPALGALSQGVTVGAGSSTQGAIGGAYQSQIPPPLSLTDVDNLISEHVKYMVEKDEFKLMKAMKFLIDQLAEKVPSQEADGIPVGSLGLEPNDFRRVEDVCNILFASTKLFFGRTALYFHPYNPSADWVRLFDLRRMKLELEREANA